MAINDNEQTTRQTRPAGREQTISFHGGGLFASPISRGVGSEFYSKLKTNLTEIYKSANAEMEIALIDLDNINEPALAFSCIVVAARQKSTPNSVAYHILILEATGDRPSPIRETINNTQVEILRVTSDALDDVLVAKANEKVSRAFPNCEVFMVDGCVIPSNINPDDKFLVHSIALNAGLATTTELAIRAKDFNDINVAHLQHDSTLNVNISFTRQQVPDAVGTPMRSDVLIDFASKKNGSNNKNVSMNSGDKEVKVSQVSGFMDLVWNPAQPAGMMSYYQAPQMQQTQKYAPRLILTNLQSNYSYTPASVLLAVATSMSLRDDNNWIQTFRPISTAGNVVDIADIGALNIEANLLNDPNGFGERIDTKSDSFRLEDLGKLVASLIQPGLIISLDCPEVGPQAWYLSVFAAASNGNQNAYRQIYQAAEQLTNGNFTKHFPVGSQMFIDVNNRVHLGTWTDNVGQKRDLRDIDHIAVCNLLGERNPQHIRDWSDTFLRTQFPLPQRLDARRKMIQGLTGETAQFTGFAARVTFSALFMEALSKGLREAGLSVRVNTPLTSADFNNARGVGGFVNQGLMAPGQSFMQQGGMQYVPQMYHTGNNNFRF